MVEQMHLQRLLIKMLMATQILLTAVFSQVLSEWSCSDNSKAVTGDNLAQAEPKGVGRDRSCILFFQSPKESAYVNVDKLYFYKY